MPVLEDPEDFIAVFVVCSEYTQKWCLEGSPFVYKLHASRYKKMAISEKQSAQTMLMI